MIARYSRTDAHMLSGAERDTCDNCRSTGRLYEHDDGFYCGPCLAELESLCPPAKDTSET